MSPRAVPLATLLSVVPYFHSHGPVRVSDAADDLGMTEKQLRGALWQLWSCGLPGYGPGDLIDLAFSSEDLDDAEFVEVTFTAGIDRPVRLTAAEAVKRSDKLLKLTLSLGPGEPERTVVSGIAKFYSPEEMVGKQVVVVANLRPAKLRGIRSEGMILCAEDEEGNLSLVTPEKEMPAGAEIC